MQNVANFIKLLGENYYLDFIIDPNSEEVSYERHFILVHYQDKNYYEITFEQIKIRQNEIIKDCKILFENALSEIFLEISKKNNDEIVKFLNLNIEAVKIKIKTLKDDCIIDNKKSRYCAILYDNFDTQYLETLYTKRDLNEEDEINSKFNQFLVRFNHTNTVSKRYYIESEYYLGTLYYRYKLLNSLPFKLFHIALKFIIELERIKKNYTIEVKSIEQKQPSNSVKMNNTYFDKFCELIDDINVLDKYSLLTLKISLIDCIKEIKSETFLELQNKGNQRNDYLDYKINEIEKRNYPKDIDPNYIKKHLTKYQITVDEIFQSNFSNAEFENIFCSNYKDFDEKQEQHSVYQLQLDFYGFLCNYYANELISFFVNNKEVKTSTLNNQVGKIKWTGKPSQLGFILGKLQELEYIEAPQKSNGDINYNEFARLVKDTFDIETTEGTLSKYLNINSEKGQETARNFDENGFDIPHKKIVS